MGVFSHEGNERESGASVERLIVFVVALSLQSFLRL